MKPEARLRHRRSMRLKGYDYAQPGVYFVTLVTWQRLCLFGEVVNGEMRLNDWGFVASNEWRRLASRFETVEIAAFVVMPNHVHGIIWIAEPEGARVIGAGQETTIQTGNDFFAPPLPDAPPLPPTLGTIIGAYKSTTARLINGLRHTPGAPLWQRNYYEHILRDEKELAHIHAYINANPASWGNDEENR